MMKMRYISMLSAAYMGQGYYIFDTSFKITILNSFKIPDAVNVRGSVAHEIAYPCSRIQLEACAMCLRCWIEGIGEAAICVNSTPVRPRVSVKLRPVRRRVPSVVLLQPVWPPRLVDGLAEHIHI